MPMSASGWSSCAATSPDPHWPTNGYRSTPPGRWLKLKTPWRDGTIHIVMSPLEFMQHLAALVPRPRLHLLRFHGVLAPTAKLRALVVPHGPEEVTGRSELTATEPGCAHGRSARINWARLLKRVLATTQLEYKLVFAEASL